MRQPSSRCDLAASGGQWSGRPETGPRTPRGGPRRCVVVPSERPCHRRPRVARPSAAPRPPRIRYRAYGRDHGAGRGLQGPSRPGGLVQAADGAVGRHRSETHLRRVLTAPGPARTPGRAAEEMRRRLPPRGGGGGRTILVAAIEATGGHPASTQPHGAGSALARLVAGTRPAPVSSTSHGAMERCPTRLSRRISRAAMATTSSSEMAIAQATQPSCWWAAAKSRMCVNEAAAAIHQTTRRARVEKRRMAMSARPGRALAVVAGHLRSRARRRTETRRARAAEACWMRSRRG
jgi:hypothetical protein